MARTYDKCIGKYICRAPGRESGGGCRKQRNDEPEINDVTEN